MKNKLKLILSILILTAVFILGSCVTSSAKIASDVEEQIASSDLSNVEVVTDENGVRIITNGLLFAPESSEVTADIASQLDALGAVLMGYSGHQLLVEGHSAKVGAESAIQALSEARAKAIAGYLVKNGYVDESQITAVGLGASVPVDTNDTPEGRAKNRRVEITILN